jgi:signal transduction histidine kinase
MESIPFQTQARTVDHLGREQIADCPTAISELWKNSYDAYAKSVELNIYAGDEPVATISDDGHGMSYEEFISRWLVIGTESKYSDEETPDEDRNGLNPRPKQGQKGIGRLSSANLGPLLLLVSKRKKSKFVAALLDWRIFENPFLLLSDIKIPVVQFNKKEEMLSHLPALFEGVTENIWGSESDKERKKRIESAWLAYDNLVVDDRPKESEELLPSDAIANTVINARFEERHIQDWQFWRDDAESGTAMLVSGINFDLVALINDSADDIAISDSKERFRETLSSFVDPFTDPAFPGVNTTDPQFKYSVRTHIGEKTRHILGSDAQLDRTDTDSAEHVIEGSIDEKGVFRGQVKAFGKWRTIESEYVIEPPKDLRIHTRKDWRVGPVDIYIAIYERELRSSTLSENVFKRLGDLSDRFSGFMIFRNGLRLLPFGRVDNDFFEIEMRRSLHAGREYWNSRRMFGRVALSRENNSNLRDKAGREGFIDSVATKTFKNLVENVLKQSARDYFGGDSDVRLGELPEIQKQKAEEKAKFERNKLRTKQRKVFRSKLKSFQKTMPGFRASLVEKEQALEINTVKEIADAQENLDSFRSDLLSYRLSGAPKELGSLEGDYREYRQNITTCNEILVKVSSKIDDSIQRINPPNPKELVEKQLQRNAGQIHSRIRKWQSEIRNLQGHEQGRIQQLIDDRNKVFHAHVLPLISKVESSELSLSKASALMEAARLEIDTENAEIFESYIRALESLTESIDIELLAMDSTEENDELRAELNRLNGLAQLGIAVEILGHELQSYDDMIGSGIRKLPKDIQSSKAVSNIRTGYDGLTNQLRFLSPLKLSGEKIQKWNTGEEIKEYVDSFYGSMLENRKIRLVCSKEFLSFRVFDQPARLIPVFINLVNNSMFWVSNADIIDKEIRLDVVSDEVVVSDNGPGVDEFDISKLFSLFFTKKLHGGRGVGLYLARANLAAGGHKIRYSKDVPDGLLSGANFMINFKGAEYGD